MRWLPATWRICTGTGPPLLIYVLTGTFETRDGATDETLLAGAGDRISIPARTLHAARCPTPATYVVGFESEQAARTFGPETPADLDAER